MLSRVNYNFNEMTPISVILQLFICSKQNVLHTCFCTHNESDKANEKKIYLVHVTYYLVRMTLFLYKCIKHLS